MEDNESRILRFLDGDMSDKEDIEFRMEMSNNPELKGEVSRINAFRVIELETRIQENSRQVIPLHVEEPKRRKQGYEYFRPFAAAGIVLSLGVAVWFWLKEPQADSRFFSAPLVESANGSLGWMDQGNTGVSVTIGVETTAAAGSSYRFERDTLWLKIPQDVGRQEVDAGKFYLLDDIQGSRMLLIWDEQQFEIEVTEGVFKPLIPLSSPE